MQCRSRSFFNLKPMSVIVYQFQTVRFIQMMSLPFGLFTQVSSSGPLGLLVTDKTYTVKPVLRGQSREGQKLAA